MGLNAAVFGREAAGSKSRSASIWRSNHSRAPGRKRPGKPGAKMADAKAFHPGDGLVQAVIFKMEPLAESHVGRVTGVNFGRRLRAVVFAQQADQQLGRALRGMAQPASERH